LVSGKRCIWCCQRSISWLAATASVLKLRGHGGLLTSLAHLKQREQIHSLNNGRLIYASHTKCVIAHKNKGSKNDKNLTIKTLWICMRGSDKFERNSWELNRLHDVRPLTTYKEKQIHAAAWLIISICSPGDSQRASSAGQPGNTPLFYICIWFCSSLTNILQIFLLFWNIANFTLSALYIMLYIYSVVPFF